MFNAVRRRIGKLLLFNWKSWNLFRSSSWRFSAQWNFSAWLCYRLIIQNRLRFVCRHWSPLLCSRPDMILWCRLYRDKSWWFGSQWSSSAWLCYRLIVWNRLWFVCIRCGCLRLHLCLRLCSVMASVARWWDWIYVCRCCRNCCRRSLCFRLCSVSTTGARQWRGPKFLLGGVRGVNHCTALKN